MAAFFLDETTNLPGSIGRNLNLRASICVGAGGDEANDDLETLVSAELMSSRPAPEFCDPSDVAYYVTDKGRGFALAKLPEPPKKTRYDEFLAYDLKFSELLLGAKVPMYEQRGGYCDREYRMYRCTDFFGVYREVEGEWRPTMKEAKAGRTR
ncbi:hypothetical protein E8F12_14440 [Pseudomonas sp. BN102]|nr:hypothetical protein [Pseudomonas sp. BN102]